MKKLIAALLSLCLMLSAVAVFAEAPAVKELNWSTYAEEASKVEGSLENVNSTDLKMFVPAQFQDSAISEEAVQKGHFLLLKSTDGKAVVTGQILPLPMDVVMAGIAQSVKGLEEGKINGIAVKSFAVESDGVVSKCIAIGTNQNSVIMFSFTPANDPNFVNLFKLMAASLQHAE